MEVPCPKCHTKYDMDRLLPVLSIGTIGCAVCFVSFNVYKIKNWLGKITIKTDLRKENEQLLTERKLAWYKCLYGSNAEQVLGNIDGKMG